MKAYIDSSAILRIIFGESHAIKFPKNITEFLASEILKIECFRTIDRMRHTLNISEDDDEQLSKAARALDFEVLGI